MRPLQPFQGWRLSFFQGVVFAVFLIFGVRLYQLQILEYENAQIAADDNRLSELPIPADRGIIDDRYGRRLAGNSPAYNVTIVPAELPATQADTLQIYNRLAALLEDVPPTIASAIASNSETASIEELVAVGEGIAPFRPVIIATDVPYHTMLRIREERWSLPGVDIQTAAVREYPYGELVSHIIGYMGPIGPEEAEALIEQGYDPAFDRVGYDGLEASLEDILAGQNGMEQREVDIAGEVIRVVEQTAPTPGQNIRLTIDVDLQAAAQQALIDQIALINEQAQAIITQRGVVIAMNPMTGEILAMVSYPSYDNSNFARAIDVDYYLQVSQDPLRPLLNQAVGAAYAPGSAWKLITAAAALEEVVIDPLTPLYDGGDLLVENYYAPNDRAADQRFVCWFDFGHEWQNIRQAITNSCNVYFYQIGGGNPAYNPQTLRPGGLGITDLFRYSTALGIGSYTGVELYGEITSVMPDPDWKRRTRGESWSTGDTYNAAFGQGYINVTPLQLINSVAVLVNGQALYHPTLIREYLDAEGSVVQPFEAQVLRTITPEEVNPDGTITLLMYEDMIIHGENSLACRCEPDSGFFSSSLCDPDGYRNNADINPDNFIEDIRPYRVYVPPTLNFNFTTICTPYRFDSSYTPPFISAENMQIVREGMRLAVSEGTASPANLPYVEVAGKTGTAQYCDDIAYALRQCEPGNWPAHAWFTAYAPYENPEILVVAFVYNGDEGSRNALPVVVRTIDAYFRLQSEREGTAPPEALPEIIVPLFPEDTQTQPAAPVEEEPAPEATPAVGAP